MKKKSIVILPLLLCILICLCGCGKETQETVFIKTPGDLREAKIAVLQDSISDIYLTYHFPNAQIFRYGNRDEALKALTDGAVDAFATDERPALKIEAETPTVKTLPDVLWEDDYVVAVKKGRTNLLDVINQTLKNLYADGTIELAYNAYMLQDPLARAELNAREYPVGDQTLRLATNASYEPFEYLDNQGNPTGFGIEVAKGIARYIGWGLEIQHVGFDMLTDSLTQDKADIVISSVTGSDERKPLLDFSVPYYSVTQLVLVRK